MVAAYTALFTLPILSAIMIPLATKILLASMIITTILSTLWSCILDVFFNKFELTKSAYRAFKNASPAVKFIKIIYTTLNLATLGLFSLITVPIKIFIPTDIETYLSKTNEEKEEKNSNANINLNTPLFSSFEKFKMKAGLVTLILAYSLKKLALTIPILLTYDTFLALKSIFTGKLFRTKTSKSARPIEPAPSLKRPLLTGTLHTAIGGFLLWTAISSSALATKISIALGASLLATLYPITLGVGGTLLLAGITTYVCRRNCFFTNPNNKLEKIDSPKVLPTV